jgi:hypothetical protein
MKENEGFEIRHNGTTRTFRDKRAAAFEAARYGKSRNPQDIIELIDRSSGEKLILLIDGRAAAFS